jgi:small subunit ribosomal protein S9
LIKKTYFYGTGKRKSAMAKVRLLSGGDGSITINNAPYDEVFNRLAHRQMIMEPFLTTNTVGKYNAVIKVIGGGTSGQCGAIAHGISRALLKVDEKLRPALRQHGLLTRDSRIKERKKPGLKRARKAPQYTKR